MFRWLSENRRFLAGVGLALAPFLLAFAALRREPAADSLSRWATEWLAPIQQGAYMAASTARTAWVDYVALVGVREENAALKIENDNLRARLAALESARDQNTRLTELTRLTDRTDGALKDSEWMGARVVGLDFSGPSRVIRIDRGKTDGVEAFMPVAGPQGMVGRILNVYRGHADVLLVDDYRSAVPGRLATTRTPLVVQGGADGLLHVAYLDVNETIEVGDAVHTAALGEIIPDGLLIGYVEGVIRRRNAMFAEATIRPASELSRIEEVIVVRQVIQRADESWMLPHLFEIAPNRPRAASERRLRTGQDRIEPTEPEPGVARNEETGASAGTPPPAAGFNNPVEEP
jgi:rod shape-determining protein MreC